MARKFDFEPLRDALGRFARRAGDGVADSHRRNKRKVDENGQQIDERDRQLGTDARTATDRARGRDAVGPYYDEIRAAHEANPDWVAHPDRWEITPADELDRLRSEYQQMVRRGELPSGHHILGLADGGTNVPANIRFTGEQRIRFSELDGLDTSFYSQYGSGTTWMNLHSSDGGVLAFGGNPHHTAVTNLQNAVHRWQSMVGLR